MSNENVNERQVEGSREDPALSGEELRAIHDLTKAGYMGYVRSAYVHSNQYGYSVSLLLEEVEPPHLDMGFFALGPDSPVERRAMMLNVALAAQTQVVPIRFDGTLPPSSNLMGTINALGCLSEAYGPRPAEESVS